MTSTVCVMQERLISMDIKSVSSKPKAKKYNLPTYKDHGGLLSNSAMNMYFTCPRKYGYKYFDKVPTEEVAAAAMDRGSAFHQLVEDDGKTVEDVLLDIVGRDLFELAKVKVAYTKYRTFQDRGLLPKLEKNEEKLISEEHQFIGYCDNIGVQDNGKWMLGEIKTTTRLDPLKWNLLEMNTQISLYSIFLKEFAHKNFLDWDDYLGVSYRTITMSQKKPLLQNKRNKSDETAHEFRERIKNDSDVFHKIVRPTDDAKHSALQAFETAKAGISEMRGRSDAGCKNTNNCFAWGRACEYFTHCHGLDPHNDSVSGTIDYET